METYTFIYQQKRWVDFVLLPVFGFITLVMAYCGVINDDGLTVLGIDLSAPMATLMYWLVAVFCLIIFAFVLWSLIASYRYAFNITIGSDALTLPTHFLSNKVLTIPYSEIRNVVEQNPKRSPLLAITYRNKKRYIFAALLEKSEDFERIKQLLVERSGIVTIK